MFRQSHLVARNSKELGRQRDGPPRLQLTRQFCRSAADSRALGPCHHLESAACSRPCTHGTLTSERVDGEPLNPVRLCQGLRRLRLCGRWALESHSVFSQGSLSRFEPRLLSEEKAATTHEDLAECSGSLTPTCLIGVFQKKQQQQKLQRIEAMAPTVVCL